MIKAICVTRVVTDTRSSGDSRTRVDAYFVEYKCPPDDLNPEPGGHIWGCRFEVPRGAKFKMSNYPDKASAKANRGFVI